MRSVRRLAVAIAVSATAWSSVAAQDGVPPNAAADSVLGRLLGDWTMIGQVAGDSVRYTLRVTRTLQGRYVSLHMLEDATPPTYEARVVIGADTVAPRVIAHWMDSFGAAYSVPAGYGTARGDSIQFTIAYSRSTFRDVFSANADGTWRLAVDAQTPNGWRSFAEYRIVPVRTVRPDP
ncbi:MAG: hypothetical protein KF709_07680 [Gemmatimonadaceae bacterium]|nr:hypothetical protein [Gemmatimonadaceae bacterium]